MPWESPTFDLCLGSDSILAALAQIGVDTPGIAFELLFRFLEIGGGGLGHLGSLASQRLSQQYHDSKKFKNHVRKINHEDSRALRLRIVD